MKCWWNKLLNKKAETMQQYILSQKQKELKNKVFGEYIVDVSKRPICPPGRCIKESGCVVNQKQLDDYEKYSKAYDKEFNRQS